MTPQTTALIAAARELLVSGSKMSTAINRAIAAADGGEQFVSSISLDPAVALAAMIAAAREDRDFSNFVSVALREYTVAHGSPAPELAETFAKIEAAHNATPEQLRPQLLAEVEKVVRNTRRTGRKAAA